MHPLLRKVKAATLRLARQAQAGLMRLMARPRSLERLLLFTIAGLVLFAIVAIALTSLGLLRDQASEQALARVSAAAHQARYEIRRVGEETVTASRLLAGRPTLARLVREGNAVQLQLFLRRFCDTAGLDACALFNETQLVVSAGKTADWRAAVEAAAEQGESFMVASGDRGPLGARAAIPGFPGGHVMTVRRLDDRLAEELSRQVGIEIRLLPMTAWLEAVEPVYRDVHSEALATGTIAVAEIPPRSEFAASLPVFASTGEAILLIQARLPASAGAGAVSSFVRRLALVAILLAGAALFASLLLARRIGAPIQALANYAERLGQGDFSSSIPAQGTQEVEALARTMDDMRRNLLDLTTTLRQNEAQAQAVLQGVVEGVYAVDADRRIRYLNPQAAKMLGGTPETLIGQFCGDVLKPREIDGRRPCDFACPIYSARDDGKAQATEYLTAGGTAAHGRHHERGAGRRPAGAGHARRDRARGRAPRARHRAREHLPRVPHAALRAARLGRAHARRPRRHAARAARRAARGPPARHAAPDTPHRQPAGERPHRVGPARHPPPAGDTRAGGRGRRGPDVGPVDATPPGAAHGHPGGPAADHGRCAAADAGRHEPARECEQVRPRGQRDHDRRGRTRAPTWSSGWKTAGSGAPELEGASIFERFYRAADREPDPRGLGLGLWIVKSIVERHGGEVRAGRTPAGTTRFTVSLPIAAGAA